ncbi:MAG: hypothetical protein HDR50_06835 [Desulfovibrio sp.]|uniref:hypothetical protein n=1 Tax=Desulfovibrio sp. TaxID=885 RepID=UPI001A7393CA|nr:hypothetical protein [Desulfovibrio sp.]MBD5417363.1 hypothetical protein [Desulfovibrio sp.]
MKKYRVMNGVRPLNGVPDFDNFEDACAAAAKAQADGATPISIWGYDGQDWYDLDDKGDIYDPTR